MIKEKRNIILKVIGGFFFASVVMVGAGMLGGIMFGWDGFALGRVLAFAITIWGGMCGVSILLIAISHKEEQVESK